MLQVEIINISISIVTSAVAVLLGLYAWRQRQVPGALWFTGIVAAVAWVTWWYAFEAAVSDNLDAYISLSKLEYIGLTMIPFLWLGFALRFTGRERPLPTIAKILLISVPIITIVLAFTNEAHGLIWKQPHFDLTYAGPVFDPVYGPWFWAYVAYSYILFLISSIVMVYYALSTWRLYRVQALVVLVGTALPGISNLTQIFDNLNPVPYLYLNAIFLGACILCFAFALFRLRLLDVAPLAYDTVFNNVPSGIIVVDLKDRILAVNTYIKPFLNSPDDNPTGQPISQAFSRYARYFDALLGQMDYVGQIEFDDQILEIRISPVDDRNGKPRGRLFVVNDVTAKAEFEKTQRAEQILTETMHRIGSALNSSLDTNRVMSLILESLYQLAPHNRFNIMLLNADGHTTELCNYLGYAANIVTLETEIAFDYRDYPLLARAAQTLSPVIVINTALEPSWIPFTWPPDILSFACIPVVIDTQLIGFINIDSEIVGNVKLDLVNRLQNFVQQAALAIKNARLFEQTSEQANELKRRVNSLLITQQIYKEIGISLNMNSMAELALDASLRISTADTGYVAMVNGNQLEIVQHYGNYDMKSLESVLNDPNGIIQHAIHNGRLMLVQDTEAIISTLPDTHSQIALPLYALGEDDNTHFYGVVVLETRSAKRFTEDRLQLLGLIGDRVALAFHNLRLINTIRERAAELEILYDKVSYLENFKSDMIRIAAHDLKNPLSVIRNYLTMLIDVSDPVIDIELDVKQIYPSMLRSAERMLHIIQDFLSLDRIERAAEQQTLEPLDLCALVSKAHDEFNVRTTQKSHHIEFVIPDSACIIEGDSAHIYEAIENLISNAIKYTPVGGHICISLVDSDDTVRFEVRDTGYGIPKEEQSKLFQPFYRFKSKQTSTIEGSGLGLHLTKNIIERQGGEIIFSSIHHKGSTFGFLMPLYHPKTEVASV